MTIGDDFRARQGATVYATAALLAADPGPTSTPRYAYVVSLDRHFYWDAGGTATPDNITVIGTNGNQGAGVWLVVPQASAITTTYRVSQTVLYTGLTDSGASKTISLYSVLPTGAVLLTRQLTLTTPFVAPGLTRLELTIGVAGGFEVMTPFRCEGSATVTKGTDGTNPQGVYGGQQLTAKFAASGALLSALTAGSITILSTYVVPVAA